MSDSPYSLSSLGRRLHSAGAWVIGLRLPGHGTAPSGLLQVKWEDMAAAVRLAMRHLSTKVIERPLYLVGYSNGGALAIQYVISGIKDSTLPKISGIVLISPAIGVRQR
jgi:alpha-beta hydrolase superfamily lysophospholipase